MMEKALERALDRADSIIESVRQNPPQRRYSSSEEKSLHEKLYDIYVEECGKEPEVTEDLRSNVKLLEKLLMRESLSFVVVNLYPGNGGYSLMLEGKNGSYTETIQLPYGEGELLQYLDAEELPPVLVDLLEKCPVNMFHSGCVIAEIRDYRQSSNWETPSYESKHILLRPTMQTLAHDIESIASDNEKWTEEDKLMLESQLILATAEPLCLDPCVSVACTENRLLYNKQKMNTYGMRKNFKQYSATSVQQQQDWPDRSPSPELGALMSCKESTAGQEYDINIPELGNYVDIWKQLPSDLVIPPVVDVEKYTKEERFVRYDDPQPTVWPVSKGKDGSLSVCEAGNQTQTRKRNTQSLNDPFNLGKSSSPKKVRCEREISSCLSSIHDQSNSSMPESKTDPGKVVSVSKELVQKKTQCPVKKLHYSAGFRKIFPKQEVKQPQATLVSPLVLGKGVKLIPVAASLPSSSGNSSSGNSFTPQLVSTSPQHQFPVITSKPLGPAQQAFVEVNPVSMPPADSLFPGCSAQRALTTQVKSSSGLCVTKGVSPVGRTQTVGRGLKLVQSSTVGAGDPSGVNPSITLGVQPPNAQFTAPQASSQPGVQYLFKTPSNLRPLTQLQVPQGTVILNIQQPAPQQQQLQQQTACHSVPQPQQSTTFYLQQPVMVLKSCAHVSTSQVTALPNQQAVIGNLQGAGSFQQSQATVLFQPGSAQTGPRQAVPQHMVLLSSAFQQQQLPQPQQVQLRMEQHPMPVAIEVAPTAQPQQGRGARGEQAKSKRKMNRCPPTTPKS